MGISLQPRHLKRYKDIATLFWKYGGSEIVKATGLNDFISGDLGPEKAGSSKQAEEFVRDIEALGPTYVKLGQLFSTRSDLLPAAFLEALARLQDKVQPFPFDEVERIVCGELGVRISKAFSEFDNVPIAAASLGQVHRAALRDGREVVVKVQRPGIRETILEDLEALDGIAEFLDHHTEMGRRYEFASILGNFRKSFLPELDYLQEARNLRRLRDSLAEHQSIIVPSPIDGYTTERVLTMDYISCRKITALNPVVFTELNGNYLADQLFRAYLKQMVIDGFFHADPHPGNVCLANDHRIVLLDLGMVGRMTPMVKEGLLQLLLALAEGRGEDAARVALKIGEAKDDFNSSAFEKQVSELIAFGQHALLENMNVGSLVLQIVKIGGECGYRLPNEFTMAAKALLNLDLIVSTLDPKFSPTEAIRRHAMEMVQDRMMGSLSPTQLFRTLLETKEFLEQLPSRFNRFFDAVTSNTFQVKVDAVDERLLIDSFQKIANRITCGLILAALIVGAALLARVPTTLTLWGYPAIAICLFLLAAMGGCILIYNAYWKDEKPPRIRHGGSR